jgi:Zn-dependent metalloprotease
MDANDILSRQMDMLEKMIKYDLQEQKRNFDNEIKGINSKLDKLDQTLMDIKDMLDGIRMIDEPQETKVPTTEELIADFKQRQEEQERLKQQQQPQQAPHPTVEPSKTNNLI